MEFTELLRSARSGDRAARDRLFGLVYDELRVLARGHRARWEGDETLNTTGLVHEAYLKLARQENPDWKDRRHFFAVASRAMRHILVDYAERRRAVRRGGGAPHLPLQDSLDDHNPVSADRAEDLLSLHRALQRLEEVEPRWARVVECRFFGGLPVEETASALGVSASTVKRDWGLARVWLHREMEREASP